MRQDDQGRDSGLDSTVLIVIVFIVAVAAILWWLLHGHIVYRVCKIGYYINWPWTFLPFMAPETERLLVEAAGRAWDISFMEMVYLFTRANVLWMPFVVAFMAWSALQAKAHPVTRARRVHDADSLIEAICAFNPTVGPFLYKDLSGDTSPAWRQNLSPPQLVKEEGLVEGKMLDEDGMRDLLIRQIGEKHNGGKSLKLHEKVMFIALGAATVTRKTELTIRMFDDLNRSCIPRKSMTPDLEAFMRDYGYLLPKIQAHLEIAKAMRVHAYTRTLLMTLLDKAQTRGVVQPALFLWLKPIDRTLYLALNNVGMRVARAECAGPWGQREAEIVAAENGSVLVRPYVETALTTFREYLENTGTILGGNT